MIEILDMAAKKQVEKKEEEIKTFVQEKHGKRNNFSVGKCLT